MVVTVSHSPTHQVANSPTASLLFVLAAFLVILLALAAGLRPDAFFVGDPGVKLIAARHVASAPGRPLNIPLPTIDNSPTPYVDPFFRVHGDHAHAITSDLFPLMSAPLLASLGLRGLYVWPALGFLGALAASAWLAREAGSRATEAVVAAVTALGTPLLFYGLEFWEHAPAVAAGTAGAALLLRSRQTKPTSTAGAFLAGALLGVAVLLRPEAIWFGLAVVVASPALSRPVGLRSITEASAGVLLAIAPLAIYSATHFGTVVPGHVSSNAALVTHDWWPARAHLAADWLVPSGWTMSGPRRTSSLWSVAPAAVLALASLPGLASNRSRRFLWLVSALYLAGVLLSAPNDGGGQWGPRYLLFAYVPLAILAAGTVQGLLDRALQAPSLGNLTRTRVSRRLAVAVLAVLVATGFWVQRAAYRQLRGAKNTYGRLVDFVAANTPAGAPIVSDVWWFDQVAAAGLDGRSVFFAESRAIGGEILERLGRTGVANVAVVRSREETPVLEGWVDGTCYEEHSRNQLDVRQLVVIALRNRCSGAR